MTAASPQPDHIETLRRSVERYVAGSDHKARLRTLRGRVPGFDRTVWQDMAALGWTGINIPIEYGGSGLGLTELAAVAEALARVCLPEPFTAACALGAAAIVEGDQAAMKAELLPAIAAGRLLPALAWQETFDQIDPLSIATTARPGAGCVVLDGEKCAVHGGAGADGYIVSARAEDGVRLYWVAAQAEGLHSMPELLADGSFRVSLRLSGVRVPEAHCVASASCTGRALPRVLEQATIAAGAELVGVATSALEATLEYLRVRRQFGRPIGSFQALQHRAVDCYVQLRLAQSVLSDALEANRSSPDGIELAAIASRVKSRCSIAGRLIAREAIQMHGAIGFTDACDVSLYVKRTLVLANWLGSAIQHRRRFAEVEPMRVSATPVAGTRVPTRLEDFEPATDWNALPDADFRLLFREFIERHYPAALRYLPRRVRWHEVREWNCLLARHGWIAPAWPRAWGGMELSPTKQLIYIEELERWGVGRAPDQGVRQLGPALIRYGSEAQKAHYLPKILSCEHVWGQGYSEPEAGSDLASVRTSAVFDGDAIVINGRKIWTSMAMDCTHIYVLCRTDPAAKKQEGISFVIVELDRPGITIRPILDIAGNEEFCEIELVDVRVPAGNLVGGLNKGWTVAKAVLDFERLGIGSPWRPRIAFNRLARLGTSLGLFEDPVFVDRFTELRMDLLDQTSLYTQFAELARRGESLGPDVSILKIWGMEAFQRVTELALEAAASHGATGGAIRTGEDEIDLLSPFYMARLITIGGGSNEIQRNIVAKHVLKLPGEPR